MKTAELLEYGKLYPRPVVIEGRMEDADGNLMRLDRIPAYEKQKDKLVRRLTMQALEVSDAIRMLKETVACELVDFIEAMARDYEKDLGGRLGNVTVYTYDRRFRIERSKQKREAVNEKVAVVIAIVEECAIRWSKGAQKNAQVVMSRYFKQDKDGNYDVQSLRDLKRLPIEEDHNFEKAKELVDGCIDVVSTATYYRFAVRDDDGVFHGIPLSISDIY